MLCCVVLCRVVLLDYGMLCSVRVLLAVFIYDVRCYVVLYCVNVCCAVVCCVKLLCAVE